MVGCRLYHGGANQNGGSGQKGRDSMRRPLIRKKKVREGGGEGVEVKN